jgi:hypothetical protein
MKFLPPCSTLAGMRQVSYTITLVTTPTVDLVGNRRRKIPVFLVICQPAKKMYSFP